MSTPGPTRYGVDRATLAAVVAGLGEPRYRADQVWAGLYGARSPLDRVTSLPRALRATLAAALPEALDVATSVESADGATRKWLWRTRRGGADVETVLMRHPTRATVCVSSQAGCAMGCTFCATGQAGLDRHLDPGEIVEQVVRAQHACPQRVTNVVFMGMGEPLANYDPVRAAVDRLHGDLGLSARQITVSTVGVVPGIRRLAGEPWPVTLAVSLHAPDDSLRDTLVPLNRRYPIAEVLDAAAEFAATRGRRVTFEYAVIPGVNDRIDQAEALGRRLAAWPGRGGAHVNLIPLNPTAGFPGGTPSSGRVRAFATALARPGVTVTVRRNRGVDIDAACGQLRARGVGTPVPLPDGVGTPIAAARGPRPAPGAPAATMGA
ncbi:MAG: 23S rRNA (adenine(2503)-C(2))-methyltransferase RlmN [Actinomycetota bacterium]